MFLRQMTAAFLVRTEPDFEHGEAGAHPHHQGAPDQKRERVEDELRLLLHRGDRPERRREQYARSRQPPAGGLGCVDANDCPACSLPSV